MDRWWRPGLYHPTDGGADALARKRREDAIRERVRPGVQQLIEAPIPEA
jgi:hypothetical protein